MGKKYKVFEVSGSPDYWKEYTFAKDEKDAERRIAKRLRNREKIISSLTTWYDTTTRKQFNKRFR